MLCSNCGAKVDLSHSECPFCHCAYEGNAELSKGGRDLAFFNKQYKASLTMAIIACVVTITSFVLMIVDQCTMFTTCNTAGIFGVATVLSAISAVCCFMEVKFKKR